MSARRDNPVESKGCDSHPGISTGDSGSLLFAHAMKNPVNSLTSKIDAYHLEREYASSG